MKRFAFCALVFYFFNSSLCSTKSKHFTFQNVTIEWYLSNGTKYTTSGKFFNNLKETYPKDADGIRTVKVNGLINTLYKNSVQEINDLYELDVSRTGLEKIEFEAFKNLPNLRNLCLAGNNLQEIQSGTFINLQCNYVNLSDNQMSVLGPGAFQNLTHLSFLYLSRNKIEEVRSGVFKNVTLRVLDLSNNLIRRLEDGFLADIIPGKLNFYLELSNNKLEEFSSNALNHPRLTHLYLDNNSISNLRTGDLANVPQLSFLNLSGNKLAEIQGSVFVNSKIRNLDLSHNEISFIASSAFDNLQSLRIIRIDHNRIKIWDNNWFRDSAALSVISASHNLIEEIPEEAFRNYQNTFSVDLQANKIKTVHNLAFCNSLGGATRLHYLILRDNEIENWNKYLLVNQANIAVYGIDLRGNRLTCFEGDLSQYFGVSVVWLSENLYSPACAQKIEKFAARYQAYQTPEVLEQIVMYK